MAKKRYLAVIGLVILAVLLSQIDLGRVAQTMANADLFWVLAALATTVLAVLAKAAKWHAALLSENISVSYGYALQLYLAGFFLSVATPGRIGDFAKAWYLKKHSPLSVGLATIFFDRIFDVAALVLAGVLGIFLFALLFQGILVPLEAALAVLVLFGIGIAVFFRGPKVFEWLKPLAKAIIPAEHQAEFGLQAREFYAACRRLFKNPVLAAKAAALSVTYVALAVGTGFFLGQSLGLPVSWAFWIAAIPVAALVDLLPVSILGLGTREATLVYAFSFAAITAESAVSFSFLLLLAGYVFLALIGLAFFVGMPAPDFSLKKTKH